jgi:vacuolar-type H+-ATPase subunit D/Vma8
VAALTAHTEFLKLQVASAKNNLQLKEVFGKLLRDCKKELSGKLIELIAQNGSLKGELVSRSESFQTRLNETEVMVDVIVAVVESKADPGVEISRAVHQSRNIQAEYKQLRKKYEESTKQGLEEAATRLEGVREQAMDVIMGIK